jgi:superkiller protein 3
MKFAKFSKLCISVLTLTIILTAGNLGCQSNKAKQTQKQQAQKRWNAARASVLGSLAKGQFEAGNFDKARESLDEAQRLDPENVALRLLYAKLAIEQNHLEVADRELTVARKLDEKNAEADYLTGVVYERWQKHQDAHDFYAAAAQKNDKELSYVLAQAEMLVVLNRQDEAMSLLDRQTESFGNHAVLHDTIGQLHMTRGEYDRAVESLRHAHTLNSEDMSIREHLAMAHFFNRQYREAHDQVTRMLRDEQQSKRGELYVTLGECQMNLARPRDARDSFDRATKLSPSSPTAWLSHTKACLELNDTRRAELSLRKAMALAPEEPECHLMLGYLRLRQDRLTDAMVAFRKASVMDPRDPVSLCMIGYVLEKSGKPEQAVQYYGRALKLRPDDELATKLMASVQDE